MYKFIVRADNSENAILRAICESEICYRSRIRRSWFTRLYTGYEFREVVTTFKVDMSQVKVKL